MDRLLTTGEVATHLRVAPETLRYWRWKGPTRGRRPDRRLGSWPARRPDRCSNVARRPDGRWRARYRDDAGRERARHFTRKSDAHRWLDEVQTWATGLSPRLAPSTLHTVVNTIRAVFAAAVRDRVIAHNPCVGVALPRVPDAASSR